MRLVLVCLVLLVRAAVAAAQTPAVLDLGSLPPMDPDGRVGYEQRFLLGNLPRAWAISSNGKYGGQWGGNGTIEAARAAALKSCADKGGTDCAIYAENLDVVWRGRSPESRPATPGPLIAEAKYAFIPDARFFWLGPQAARGVLVWSHGYDEAGADYRQSQPPPYVRAFNNAGFDIVRFARDPVWDGRRDEVADWLRSGLKEMRRRGWKMVIAAGQSRGAWNSLQALDTPDIADAVIAVSPAASGTSSGVQIVMGNPALWIITSDARAAHTRVAFVQFRDDPFYTNGDQRVSTIKRLQGKVAALLIVDRPDGFKGHGAGNSAAFAERFGACLLRFATAPAPGEGC
jgi:hypothetical protein